MQDPFLANVLEGGLFRIDIISEMAFHTCDEIQAFKEAFDAFDWNKSGTISYKSLQVSFDVHYLKYVCIICP